MACGLLGRAAAVEVAGPAGGNLWDRHQHGSVIYGTEASVSLDALLFVRDMTFPPRARVARERQLARVGVQSVNTSPGVVMSSEEQVNV